MTTAEAASQQLSQVIATAFRTAFERDGEIGILFSGGVDSALMAQLAKEVFRPQLYATGVAGSKDIKSASKVASKLNLDVKTIIIDQDNLVNYLKTSISILEDYDVIDIELGIPLAVCAQQASKEGIDYLAMGQGAEELFAGYRRHERAYKSGKSLNEMLRKEVETLEATEIKRDELIMSHYGLTGIYPFLEEDLIELALELPADLKITSDYKKWVLRLAAKELGVPEEAWKRPKSALQYGSGVHKLIEKRARRKFRDVEQVKREGFHGPIDKWLHQLWRETI